MVCAAALLSFLQESQVPSPFSLQGVERCLLGVVVFVVAWLRLVDGGGFPSDVIESGKETPPAGAAPARESAMAVSGSAMAGLREEASCPVCLDYFKDPVMLISCGHNFCQGCLARCTQQGPSRCPQCREPFLREHLRANLQLASLVNVARRLGLEAGCGGRECQQHREPLKLFCREDQALICLVCRESLDHRGHQVLPTEEAAQEYKVHSPVQAPLTAALPTCLPACGTHGHRVEGGETLAKRFTRGQGKEGGAGTEKKLKVP